MKLLIDIGNTRNKYAIYENEVLSAVQFIDEADFDEQWFVKNFANIHQCIVANVNRAQISDSIMQWCRNSNIECLLLESEDEKFGVRCAYEQPETFGIDRWLTLIGAEKLFPQQSCLIVDAGTATTVDMLSEKGVHQGGWILPGIDLLFTCLTHNTAKVFASLSNVSALNFANNTSDAVNQASWAATLGLINSAIETVERDLQKERQSVNIIFTGGNAAQLQQLFEGQSTLIENLIFVGMQRYC